MKINQNYITYNINLIQYIEIKISLKNNTTYWVKVNNTLKRIAKIYFFILKEKGLLLKEKQKKIRCLGLTRNNLQCKRKVENSYCFQHKKKKINFIDLFCGAGGFSLGLKKAGLKHLYGVDSWNIASNTYRTNIGFNICEDLERLNPFKLTKKVDLLVGSPPCQVFSSANRNNSNSNKKKDDSYLSFLKFLNFYNPKVFILENVIGLLSYKINNFKVIDIMLEKLSINFNVKVYKICCTNFGVVQKRKRVIIIGVNKKYGSFFPDLKTYPLSIKLRDLLLDKNEIPLSFFLSKKAIAGILRRKKKNISRGNGFGAQYIDINGFCNTITSNYYKDGYSNLIKYSNNETQIRRLTEIELKKIQGFPDEFFFSGSKTDRYIQIGNSVPPQLSYYLGKQVLDFLNKIGSN